MSECKECGKTLPGHFANCSLPNTTQGQRIKGAGEDLSSLASRSSASRAAMRRMVQLWWSYRREEEATSARHHEEWVEWYGKIKAADAQLAALEAEHERLREENKLLMTFSSEETLRKLKEDSGE